MAHKYDRLGAILEAVVDRGQRTSNALSVSDGAALLQRYVEIDTHQDALVFDQLWDPIYSELT